MAASVPDPAITPQAYLQPIGLSPMEANAVLEVAARNNGAVQWQRPPPDCPPDVYVAHLRSIDLPDDGSDSAPPWSMDRYPPRIVVDEHGHYQGHPVCLIGGCESNHLAWNASEAESVGELNASLRFAAAQLSPQRIRYAIGRTAWLNREVWATSQLQLLSHGQIMTVIDPAGGLAHLRRTATAIQVERVALKVVPARTLAPSPEFESKPLPAMLWELARRCNDEALPGLLPPALLRGPLASAHPTATLLDERGQSPLDLLAAGPLTAAELQGRSKLPEALFMRTLAGMAITNAVRVQRPNLSPRHIADRAVGWLRGLRL